MVQDDSVVIEFTASATDGIEQHRIQKSEILLDTLARNTVVLLGQPQVIRSPWLFWDVR